MSSQEGTVKITLPDGSVQEYPQAVWSEMLENIQQQCDDHFKDGEKPLQEAYRAFLQTGLSGAQSISGASGSQQGSRAS